MSENMTDRRVAQINIDEIFEIKISSEGFIIPITDHSGLRININIGADQAGFMAGYLQMAIYNRSSIKGPQLYKNIKAPVAIDVQEWSMGLKENQNNIIARFKNKEGEIFDFDLDVDTASRICSDINNFVSISKSR